MAIKNSDKYIVTNEIIMNKQNLWYMNMYICISTPNEIFISCFGTINEIFKTGININKIYGTSFNIYQIFGTNTNTCINEIFGTGIKFYENLCNRYYICNIKRSGWSWPF